MGLLFSLNGRKYKLNDKEGKITPITRQKKILSPSTLTQT